MVGPCPGVGLWLWGLHSGRSRHFWQVVFSVKPQGCRAVSSLSSHGHLCGRRLFPQRAAVCRVLGVPSGHLHAVDTHFSYGRWCPWRLLHKTDTGFSTPSPSSTHVSEGTPTPAGLCPAPSSVGAVFRAGSCGSGGSGCCDT